jgi:hypothetical protein
MKNSSHPRSIHVTGTSPMKVSSRACVHRAIARYGNISRRQRSLTSSRWLLTCKAASDAAEPSTAKEAPENASTGDGRMTYKPETFDEIVSDAVAAMERALATGLTRMEVEFPSVSSQDCAVSSAALALPLICFLVAVMNSFALLDGLISMGFPMCHLVAVPSRKSVWRCEPSTRQSRHHAG